MGRWTSSFKDEFSVVTAAPRLAALAFVSVVAAVWTLAGVRYDGELGGLKQQVVTLETQMQGKDDLIARLEKKIAEDAALIETVRSAYQDLLTTQVPGLTSLLSGTPSKVEIVGGAEAQGTPLFQQLRETFTDSGWSVGVAPTAQPVEWLATATEAAHVVPSGIVLALPDTESGKAIKAAFDAADIPYSLWTGPDEPKVPQVWITSGKSFFETSLVPQP